ncbi:MAG TPA: hypothetical protein VGB11_08200 [Candidatus Bathyarchaeia archaeon]|jgi:hypothetical protein
MEGKTEMVIKKPKHQKLPQTSAQDDFAKFIEDYVFLLGEMGAFVTTMGKTEQKHPDMFEQVKKLASPEVLSEFVDKVPPDILAILFKTMMRFTKISQIKDIMTLPPQEKIDVGTEMIQISQDLSELMKKVRGL